MRGFFVYECNEEAVFFGEEGGYKGMNEFLDMGKVRGNSHVV